MAESMRLANSASPRELKRANSAVGEHGHRNAGIDRALHGPATLARIGDVAGKLLEAGIDGQLAGQQIEQPRAHHAAVTPELGDLIELEVEAVRLLLHRRGLGIDDRSPRPRR